jgi:hypothetical protein
VQASRILQLRVCGFLCLGLLFAIAASARPIRLQNETIQPTAQRMAAAATETVPAGYLVLLQFNGPPQSGWREQVEALGVQLLRYVPENTFVADLNGVPPGQLRKLEFIAWLGPYRPEHKIHRGLTQTNSATSTQARAAAASEAISISVLLSPRAPVAEAQNARGLFSRVGQESRPGRAPCFAAKSIPVNFNPSPALVRCFGLNPRRKSNSLTRSAATSLRARVRWARP